MHGIYLNSAATSYPKPPAVVAAVTSWLTRQPVDPGRDACSEDDPRTRCRAAVAALFGVSDPRHIALLPSATYALNTVITGLLAAGDHAVTTALEHNSVLRPLHHVLGRGKEALTIIDAGPLGTADPEDVRLAIRPTTRLIAVTHASNVTGSVQPVEEIAAVAAGAGVPLLVDASQTAGVVSLAHSRLPGRVYIAWAGHKSMLGPPGVGGLVLPDGEMPQTVFGGTGFRSESLVHPGDLPLRHEAGTPNYPAIEGLTAGLTALEELGGAEAAGAARDRLVAALLAGLAAVPGVRAFTPANGDGRAGIVSFTVVGWSPEELAYVLQTSFGITTRAGLHCAPLAHRGLGTAPLGTVRASFGPGSEHSHVVALVDALRHLQGG